MGSRTWFGKDDGSRRADDEYPHQLQRQRRRHQTRVDIHLLGPGRDSTPPLSRSSLSLNASPTFLRPGQPVAFIQCQRVKPKLHLLDLLWICCRAIKVMVRTR